MKKKQQIDDYLRIASFVTTTILILKKILIQRAIALRNSKTINLDCANNFEVALVFTIEKMKFAKCDKCFKKQDPFVNCVTMKNQFRGFCSNCHYSNENEKCNFRFFQNL